MHFDVLTLFPAIVNGPLHESILKRAMDTGRLVVAVHNIRDYALDKHHVTDDVPYGGGGGMVMKPEPVFAAVQAALADTPSMRPPIILMTPQGRRFTQAVARELAQHERIVLICGRYEGVDERVREFLATDEISIGDYVPTGGELPALVVMDAVTRPCPACWATQARRWRIRTRTACSNIRITLARRTMKDTPCRRCSCPGTTRKWNVGGVRQACAAPGSTGPTCWLRPIFLKRIASSATDGQGGLTD
jgi:tRNA (guanine-N1)-methyltransferase